MADRFVEQSLEIDRLADESSVLTRLVRQSEARLAEIGQEITEHKAVLSALETVKREYPDG